MRTGSVDFTDWYGEEVDADLLDALLDIVNEVAESLV
jgi:hypothetical protein